MRRGRRSTVRLAGCIGVVLLGILSASCSSGGSKAIAGSTGVGTFSPAQVEQRLAGTPFPDAGLGAPVSFDPNDQGQYIDITKSWVIGWVTNGARLQVFITPSSAAAEQAMQDRDRLVVSNGDKNVPVQPMGADCSTGHTVSCQWADRNVRMWCFVTPGNESRCTALFTVAKQHLEAVAPANGY